MKKKINNNYKKREGLYEKVYFVIRKIPKGKVATYGQIARIVGTKDARKVGWALHGNKDSNTPCHRVVTKEGRLAENFAFDGWKEQKRRLETEGIEFSKEKYVDLEKHLWEPRK